MVALVSKGKLQLILLECIVSVTVLSSVLFILDHSGLESEGREASYQTFFVKPDNVLTRSLISLVKIWRQKLYWVILRDAASTRLSCRSSNTVS